MAQWIASILAMDASRTGIPGIFMFIQTLRSFRVRPQESAAGQSAVGPTDSNLDKIPLRIEDPKLHDHTGCIRLSVSKDSVSAIFSLARDRGWGCQIASVDGVSPTGLTLLDLNVPRRRCDRTCYRVPSKS